MQAAESVSNRVTVDGKFFRLGDGKFFPKGVSYGPFAPNADFEPFASPEQTARDFVQIRELNANVIRVYYVPPRWLLNLAASPIMSSQKRTWKLRSQTFFHASAIQC